MYEINEHSRMLGDGTEITTYEREVYAPANQAGWTIMISLMVMAVVLIGLVQWMIQRLVLDELATKVLAGEIPDGSRVEADFDPDPPEKIAFAVKC